MNSTDRANEQPPVTLAALRDSVGADPRMRRRGIQRESEFERILALPRRQWSTDDLEWLARGVADILRRPGGQQSLRPIQAWALAEMVWCGGLLAPIRVGAGKTLITLLAPTVMASRRSLLLLPAKLVDKTKREMREYARHWRIGANLSIVSYEKLSHIGGAKLLDSLSPDLIICDEAHKVKNLKAAVTRRLRRYVEQAKPAFVALSGTLVRRRLVEWAHTAGWSLREGSPAPLKRAIAESWATALDEGATGSPGVLYRLWDTDANAAPVESICDVWRRRVTDTPGVVATASAYGGALNFAKLPLDLPAAIRDSLSLLESDWTLPDGRTLTDALDYLRAARQLELGCYYRWRVRPPDEWREARIEWSRFVRHTIRYSRSLDSELAVRRECALGRLDRQAYDWWQRLRPTFLPETECVWLDDSPVRQLIALATGDDPWLIWLHHQEIGARFSQLGMPYFGAGGRDATKRYIESYRGSCALSIESNFEGRNLQAGWSQMVIAEMPRDALRIEQLIGRVHRDGQEADECSIVFHVSTKAAESVMARNLESAQWLEQSTGQPQKLLQGTWV